MKTHQSKLNNREEVAEGTMAFHLEKPAGFQFKAGQYLDITLVNPPESDSQGITRTFSIASAPYAIQRRLIGHRSARRSSLSPWDISLNARMRASTCAAR